MSEPAVHPSGWKVTTHDLRPPIQGGKPIFDGTTPYQVPTVLLDTSSQECGHD